MFLEGDPGVATVTKTGLIVCDKTYFFANVSSVGLAWRRKHKISGWFLITLGTMWILFGFLTAQGFNFVAGLALLGWGMWLRDKVDYIVRLRTPGGESDVLTTRNREFAQRIVNAVEQAIASRG